MKLTVKRIAKRATYTIGKLYIDGQYFCDTLEDTDRGLEQAMPLDMIRRTKVPGETAIPVGTYELSMRPGFGPYPRVEQFVRDPVKSDLVVQIKAGDPRIDIGFPPAAVEHLR